MIDLAKVFGSDIELTKNNVGEYLVSIRRVSWKENRHDCMARSLFASGPTVEKACWNFMQEARGKLLFGDDAGFYGKDRPEYVCV